MWIVDSTLGPNALRWDLFGRSVSNTTYGTIETRSVRGVSAAERTEASNFAGIVLGFPGMLLHAGHRPFFSSWKG
ncbi:hypothetical protein NC796_23810 [Aliifodinibius sp. S!AR15-10]|uniref:hypothetical protein n=1 Tax=Aliifodinibius sp. S!AR15-10 TaxID=2950437 RepID=UPI002861F9D3|nr:hypothetical protein [Aliifodinibius sp. S!AR15-10]MDR8394195.1 hypothetical protein [Aliifodinibius sp. S!AR15-10]